MSKRLLMPFFLLCISILNPFGINAQEVEEAKNGMRNDSIFLSKAIETTNVLFSNPAEAKDLGKDLLRLTDTAEFAKRKNGSYHSNQIMAVIFGRMGNQDSAINYYQISLHEAQRLEDTTLLGPAHYNLAIAYEKKGFLLTAMEYLDSSITFRRLSGDAVGLARAYQLQLVFNHDLGDYRYSEDYAQKGLAILDTITVKHGTMQRAIDEIYSTILTSLGNAYLEFNQTDSAFSCYSRALEFMNRSDLSNHKPTNFLNICDALVAQGKYSEALKKAKEGLEVTKEYNLSYKIPAFHLRIGQAETGLRRFESSINSFMLGLSMLDTIDDSWLLQEYYDAIIQSYRGSGDLSQSIVYSEKSDSITDFLLSQEQQARRQELAARFELNEKEMTLKFTKEKVALQEVIIDQKERQNTLYALSGAAVSLLLVLMIYLFLQLKNQKNKVDELNEQLTEHIDFQNSVSTVLTHDIRNFLNALQVGPDLILRQLDRDNIPKAKKLTESLGTKFTGMYEAISNILLWATPQLKSGMAGEAEIFDVAELVQDQKNSLVSLAEEKGFSIQYEGPSDHSLQAFKAATEVIIRNAALNALNHSGGNKLILQLEIEEETWKVKISDNGKGLDEKTQQVLHISQAEMRQRLKGDQSGFGLWIIRFYSEASQAKIDYTFKDGWSTFQFDFPKTLDA